LIKVSELLGMLWMIVYSGSIFHFKLKLVLMEMATYCNLHMTVHPLLNIKHTQQLFAWRSWGVGTFHFCKPLWYCSCITFSQEKHENIWSMSSCVCPTIRDDSFIWIKCKNKRGLIFKNVSILVNDLYYSWIQIKLLINEIDENFLSEQIHFQTR
jgi:hypothetical protein